MVIDSYVISSLDREEFSFELLQLITRFEIPRRTE
jgi:hypothetical protein